jgi:protoheme IX farnesyltransferase
MRRGAPAYLNLCKLRVAALSSFSAAVGGIVPAHGMTRQTAGLVIGVFVLACGASAMNQYQERDTDARMPRTAQRPIPSGRISRANVLTFSLFLLVSGLAITFLSGGMSAAILGVLAVAWYNGIYTTLKQWTAFAVVPGAVVGALPVGMGWVAAGGSISDPRVFALCFFFFMWQIPHSWLFTVRYGSEYEAAGLPSLTALFSKHQLLRINFIWVVSTAVSCVLITGSGVARSSAVNTCLVMLSSWLIWSGVRLLLWPKTEDVFAPAFRRSNIFLFFVLALLAADSFISPMS